MKHKTLLFTLAAALTLGLASCGKNEPVTPTVNDANRAVGSATDTVAKAAEAAKTAEAAEAAKVAEAAKAADVAKAEAARAADAAKAEAAKTAETAKAADSGKAQGLIDKVKSLIAEGKLSDASNVLQQLAGQSLTSDQAKLVSGLKEQTQKALVAKAAENAAGSVGNLLKK